MKFSTKLLHQMTLRVTFRLLRLAVLWLDLDESLFKATATASTTAKIFRSVQNSSRDSIEHIIVCFLAPLLSLDYFMCTFYVYTDDCLRTRLVRITLSPAILPVTMIATLEMYT